MISITTDTVTEAAKEGFFNLLSCPQNTSDPTILRESVAAIEVTNPSLEQQGFIIQNNSFVYQKNYQDYIPSIDTELVSEEERDYTRLFISSGHIDSIIHHLIKFPASRRNLISSWAPIYLDPTVVGVCITHLYFRLYNGKLEVHSHARANDAYRLLLLDMQLATSIQAEVAKAIDKPVGKYIHFSDSLHFYKQYENVIEQQKAYMTTSEIWA